MLMQQVCETTSQAFTLMAAVDNGVRGKPRPLSPEPITFNFASRTTDNLKQKEFLETNLNPKFFKWPVSSGGFFKLTWPLCCIIRN